MVQITKLYNTTDAQGFRAFGRVMSGVVSKGMEVKVLGEGYSLEDEEDMVDLDEASELDEESLEGDEATTDGDEDSIDESIR